ncbi:extensin family protein [Oceaniglobus ichthyenteri]|uniref:extensin-like domain-containing protein n=1 Tax=Oceaniglobus ichthyenteri TaxID=2136177 RepID=UPI000D3D9E0C|nr:extensin family protein [Oceaniglobus ichthyenteri]
MTRFGAFFLAFTVAFGAVAEAKAPATSPRPEPRARDVVTRAVVEQIVSDVQKSRVTPVVVQATLGARMARSPRPPARPENLHRRAVVTAVGFRAVPPSVSGSVCGDPDIRGSRMSPIAGRIRGCGVDAPVRVTSVAGLALSSAATMDCATAQALKTWVDRGVKPTIGRLGGGAAGLQVAAHYSCRTRNNKPGAKVSEHGKGRAIDISAIVLRNGVSISVLKGWRSAQHRKILHNLHRAACGPFGTVLGPNADRYHQDHFHFDTARYRSGSYCR